MRAWRPPLPPRCARRDDGPPRAPAPDAPDAHSPHVPEGTLAHVPVVGVEEVRHSPRSRVVLSKCCAGGGIRTCQATGSQKGPAARGHAQRGARKRVHIPLVSPKQQENTLLKGQVRFIDARRARNAGRVVVRTISPVRHTCATHRCHLCTPTPRILPVVGRTLAGPSHRCGGACVCRRRVTSVTHPNVLLSPRHRGQGWRSPRPRCSGRTCRQRVASQSRPGFPSQGV